MENCSTTMPQKKTRLDYIDILNILAPLAVVAMHSTGKIFQFDHSYSWITALLIQCVSHFAIPVFFMITGITLLEYRSKYDTKTFFKKRFLKTVLPFLFWSVFYIFYCRYPNLPSFRESVNMILNNKVLNIFWFFYELFGLYISIPLLSCLAKKENEKPILYFCMLFFFFRALFPLLTKIIPISYSIVPIITNGSVGYLFLGYILKHETFSKKTRYCIYTAGFFALLLMMFGTYYVSNKQGKTDTLFLDYYSLATMPYSVAVLLFIKHCNWEKFYKVIPKKFIETIASTSFGIYLLHMIFFIGFDKYKLFLTVPNSIRMILRIIIIYPLCVLITLLIKKIPILKNILP